MQGKHFSSSASYCHNHSDLYRETLARCSIKPLISKPVSFSHPPLFGLLKSTVKIQELHYNVTSDLTSFRFCLVKLCRTDISSMKTNEEFILKDLYFSTADY